MNLVEEGWANKYAWYLDQFGKAVAILGYTYKFYVGKEDDDNSDRDDVEEDPYFGNMTIEGPHMAESTMAIADVRREVAAVIDKLGSTIDLDYHLYWDMLGSPRRGGCMRPWYLSSLKRMLASMPESLKLPTYEVLACRSIRMVPSDREPSTLPLKGLICLPLNLVRVRMREGFRETLESGFYRKIIFVNSNEFSLIERFEVWWRKHLQRLRFESMCHGIRSAVESTFSLLSSWRRCQMRS